LNRSAGKPAGRFFCDLDLQQSVGSCGPGPLLRDLDHTRGA